MADKRKKSSAKVPAPQTPVVANIMGWQLKPSHLGYPEVTAPAAFGSGDRVLGGITFPDGDTLAEKARSLHIPSTIVKELTGSGYYSGDPAVLYPVNPSPTTLAHERIHVGQHLSGYNPYKPDAYPEPKNLTLFNQLLSGAGKLGLFPAIPGFANEVSANEAPAYSFADPQRYDPDAFAAYVDDVHRNAPRPAALEASLPMQMMHRYLQTHPVPYRAKLPLPDMQLQPVTQDQPQSNALVFALRRLMGIK